MSRDWVVLVQVPTEEFLDSLAIQVAETIAGLTEAREVGVRSLQPHSDELTLELHIRPPAPVSADDAHVLGAELLERYAPGHDLAATRISVRSLG